MSPSTIFVSPVFFPFFVASEFPVPQLLPPNSLALYSRVPCHGASPPQPRYGKTRGGRPPELRRPFPTRFPPRGSPPRPFSLRFPFPLAARAPSRHSCQRRATGEGTNEPDAESRTVASRPKEGNRLRSTTVTRRRTGTAWTRQGP